MRRILIVLLVVGLWWPLQGCQSQKKNADENRADTERVALEDVTPEQEASTNRHAPQPEANAPVTVETVEPDEPVVSKTAGNVRKHVVQKGDTLFKLARLCYGDQKYWKKIWQANIDIIPNPNELKIGQELVIP